MIKDDSVRVTTLVAVAPDVAFAIFTQKTDLWWGKGPRFRPLSHPQGRMIFEGKAGGRLLERVDPASGADQTSTPDFVLGRISVWDPPARLVFAMGGRDFSRDVEADSEKASAPEDWTVVEIFFEAAAEGTRVHLEHRGFSKLATDHPVRHGFDTEAFLDVMGIFWADLLSSAQRFSNATTGDAKR